MVESGEIEMGNFWPLNCTLTVMREGAVTAAASPPPSIFLEQIDRQAFLSSLSFYRQPSTLSSTAAMNLDDEHKVLGLLFAHTRWRVFNWQIAEKYLRT